MELRDYLLMLRRGWATIAASVVLAVGLASMYLLVTPKQYDATSAVVIVPDDPASVSDLQLGSQFAVSNAPTYADLIDSPAVLGPAADDLGRPDDTAALVEAVTSIAREATSIIDITAVAGSGEDAAAIVNAAAERAAQVVPGLSRAGAGAGSALVDVQIVAPAPAPSAPVSPVTTRVLTLGAAVGLILGLALTVTRQSLDTRLRRPDDLRPVTDVPLLTALARPHRTQRSGVVVRDHPASASVETYRSLRTNLSHLDDGDNRSILFTGATSDRDAVKVPTNLAWSLAQAGRTVLLMDLDLRDAPVAGLLGLQNRGLAEVLSDDVDLFDVVRDTAQPRLQVALAGTLQGNPSDLLTGAAVSHLLRLAEEHYDFVVLHAPSLLQYTDAAVLSRMAGHTVVVVASGVTRADDLTAALEVLSNVRVAPLGLVLLDSHSVTGKPDTQREARVKEHPDSGQVRGRRMAAPVTDDVDQSGDTPSEPQRRAKRAKPR